MFIKLKVLLINELNTKLKVAGTCSVTVLCIRLAIHIMFFRELLGPLQCSILLWYSRSAKMFLHKSINNNKCLESIKEHD